MTSNMSAPDDFMKASHIAARPCTEQAMQAASPQCQYHELNGAGSWHGRELHLRVSTVCGLMFPMVDTVLTTKAGAQWPGGQCPAASSQVLAPLCTGLGTSGRNCTAACAEGIGDVIALVFRSLWVSYSFIPTLHASVMTWQC